MQVSWFLGFALRSYNQKGLKVLCKFPKKFKALILGLEDYPHFKNLNHFSWDSFCCSSWNFHSRMAMSSSSSLFVLSLPIKLCNNNNYVTNSSSKHLSRPLSGNHCRSLARVYTLRHSRICSAPTRSPLQNRGRSSCICLYSGEESEQKEDEFDWPILRRWDVPWKWQTVSLTSLACGLSVVLTGLVETAAIPYLGLQIGELSLDEKAEILFVDQAITTAVVLAVLYGITNSIEPLSEDVFRYDLREPFNLRKGWILWAGIGLVGALIAIALTGVAVSFFSGQTPERETDALVRLLPLIGSSSVSTACLVGITGVLAPLLEETVFRGFLMVALTKWLPTPLSIVVSAAVFAIAHLTSGEFPQLFVLGTALGLSYAQTRNLLTPITIRALWNSGVILLLTFLELRGYDIKELIQAS